MGNRQLTRAGETGNGHPARLWMSEGRNDKFMTKQPVTCASGQGRGLRSACRESQKLPPIHL
jgi:hypothetical protein